MTAPPPAAGGRSAAPGAGTGPRPPGPEGLQALIDLTTTACVAYGRDDLVERVERVRELVARDGIRVVVVGEFKQGKSSLVNALVGADVCPVDDDVATAVPTALRHGSGGASVVVRRVDPTTGQPVESAEAERRPIGLDAVRGHAMALHADPDWRVEGVEIELERELLRSGLVLIDTPGVGGLGSAHATAALGALSLADAAIFVTDASQELTATEAEFLRRAHELCEHVIGVVTKIDLYPAWRTVAELDRTHLARILPGTPVLTVSSALRHEALRRSDRQVNTESGFPALVRLLLDDVVAASRDRLAARVVDELVAVCEQLDAQFAAVIATTDDPERARDVIARLERARARADELKQRSARWSTTLNDGFADLSSDVDHDLRERIRRVLADADAAIEAADPAEAWAEFEPWLVQRISYEVVTNYRYLSDRATHLSGEVAAHFDIDGERLLAELDVRTPTEVIEGIGDAPEVEGQQMSVFGQGMSVLRGSYSGVLMFTAVGSLVGLTLGPVAIGIGLLMGRKSLRDEKQRQLAQRRVQARNSVRRYTDEVSFRMGKDARDTLRRVQRQLRDHYTARAEELHRSTSEALAAAQQAAAADETDTARRRRDAEAELRRIAQLRERIRGSVAGEPS